MTLKEPLKKNCKWGGVLYCQTTNEHCKNYYSLILATKMSGKKLSIIEYSQANKGDSCQISLVEIE